MCTTYAEIDCKVTDSTIDTPDATFVAPQVGEILPFRGLTTSIDLNQNVTPDTVVINLPNYEPPPVPMSQYVSGWAGTLNYSLLPNPEEEQPIPLGGGMGSTPPSMLGLTEVDVTIAGFYRILYTPMWVRNGFGPTATIIFRMRNQVNTIFAEFYSKLLGNDEISILFSQVMYLPVGQYRFTAQATSTDYLDIRVYYPAIEVAALSA